MKPHYLVSLCLLFVLAACSDVPEGPSTHSKIYTPPPTPGGRMCMNQCNESHDYCQKSCDFDYRACYYNVQAAAQVEYDRYAQQHFSDRTPTVLLPSDFEHPDDCNAAKKECYDDCLPAYDSCYRSCGGTVQVTSSCQFLCFE